MKLKKHRYNIRIKNTSNKQAKRNRELAKIKSDLEPICYICGRWGANDLAHILFKAGFPQYYTKDWNLIILCRECHNKFDENVDFRREQSKLYERVCQNVKEEDKGRVLKYFGKL